MKSAASFLSAALFAAGLFVFAFPAAESVAQTTVIPERPPISEMGCRLRILGSFYNPTGGSAGDGGCECPEGMRLVEPSPLPPNSEGLCEAPRAADACSHITGGMLDEANNVCGCAADGEEIFEKSDGTTACEAPVACIFGVRNGDNECECPAGFSLENAQTGLCMQNASPIDPATEYSENDCLASGWGVREERDGSNNIAQVCAIPLLGQGAAPTARQFSPSARTTGCLLVVDGAYDTSHSSVSGLPRCGAADVFGDGGIPVRPTDFNPLRHRIVLSCPSGFERDPNDGRLCAAVRVVAPGGGGVSGSGGESGGKTSGAQRFAIGAGIIILAGAAVGAWDEGGNLSAFSLSPSADYEYDDGAWRARHGARLNYHNDAWSLWWSAEQTRIGDDSESRFGWGGAWRGEVLRLDAAALISDDSTGLRAGAGAEWDFHGWALRPSWQLRAETAERGVWSSRMDADIAAEWARLGWKVRPSFGATGSLGDAAADEAFMRLRVERTLGW